MLAVPVGDDTVGAADVVLEARILAARVRSQGRAPRCVDRYLRITGEIDARVAVLYEHAYTLSQLNCNPEPPIPQPIY